MKLSEQEAAYEAARMWAFSPISHPPPGWAQIVRGGLAVWIREQHAPVVSASFLPQPARLKVSALLTMVAAMIAEVCQ
jgi:hypothetical protein